MADRYIPEHRRTTFKAKNTFKPDELRRRREEQQVEIRKQKREENLAKRRGITGRSDGAPGAALGAAPDSDDESMNIESQVSLQLSHESHPGRAGKSRYEITSRLTLYLAERRAPSDGQGRLLGQDRGPNRRDNKVPQASVQGAQPTHRKGY